MAAKRLDKPTHDPGTDAEGGSPKTGRHARHRFLAHRAHFSKHAHTHTHTHTHTHRQRQGKKLTECERQTEKRKWETHKHIHTPTVLQQWHRNKHPPAGAETTGFGSRAERPSVERAAHRPAGRPVFEIPGARLPGRLTRTASGRVGGWDAALLPPDSACAFNILGSPMPRLLASGDGPVDPVKRSGWSLGAPPPRHCHGGLLFARPQGAVALTTVGTTVTQEPPLAARACALSVPPRAPLPAVRLPPLKRTVAAGRQGLSYCSLGSGCLRGPVGGRVGEAAAGGVPGSNPRSPVFRTSLSRFPSGEGELQGACGGLRTPLQIR